MTPKQGKLPVRTYRYERGDSLNKFIARCVDRNLQFAVVWEGHECVITVVGA